MKNNELSTFTQKPFKIKEITVGASRTINLGNYESMQIQGSCTIEVDDPSQVNFAREQALQEIKTQMNDAYRAIKPKKIIKGGKP